MDTALADCVISKNPFCEPLESFYFTKSRESQLVEKLFVSVELL